MKPNAGVRQARINLGNDAYKRPRLTQLFFSNPQETTSPHTHTKMPSVADNTSNGPIEGNVLPQSKFIQHLSEYPAVAAVTGFAASFPVVKIFASNAVPLIQAIQNRGAPVAEPVVKRAAPFISQIDNVADEYLNRLDKAVPALKNTKPDEVYNRIVTQPIENVRGTVDKYADETKNTVSRVVVQPIRDVASRVQSQVVTYYDAHGKPIVHARLDPIFHPLNDRLEALINAYLPKGQEIVSDAENELTRAWRLTVVAFDRARPLIEQQTSQIQELNQHTREHIQKVYDGKRSEIDDKKTVSGPVYATVATVRDLSQEGYQYAQSILNAKKPEDKADASSGVAPVSQPHTTSAVDNSLAAPTAVHEVTASA